MHSRMLAQTPTELNTRIHASRLSRRCTDINMCKCVCDDACDVRRTCTTCIRLWSLRAGALHALRFIYLEYGHATASGAEWHIACTIYIKHMYSICLVSTILSPWKTNVQCPNNGHCRLMVHLIETLELYNLSSLLSGSTHSTRSSRSPQPALARIRVAPVSINIWISRAAVILFADQQTQFQYKECLPICRLCPQLAAARKCTLIYSVRYRVNW